VLYSSRKLSRFVFSVLLAVGCTASYHSRELHSERDRQMTLGIVQKEIRRGLSQADVAEALGSPNIVTRDSAGHETWVYDKMATEASYSNSSVYGSVLVVGVARNAGASATTQRTLTVLIKFDDGGKVDSFSYHASQF
jgi:outer membrane protein assembly factor BamE (lipoprotein component of BamABCDE complex)